MIKNDTSSLKYTGTHEFNECPSLILCWFIMTQLQPWYQLHTKWHYLKINSRMINIELDIMSTSAGTAILIAAVMLVFYEFCMITWLLVNQLVLTTPETVSLLMDSKLFFCQCA